MSNSFETSGDKVPLAGKLLEFRTALLHEIEAAKRNAASSSVTLLNGKRIGQIGNNFQYLFTIDNALNLPSDAPGNLYVPEHTPIEVIVVAVDGMSITLSVSKDFGAFVPIAHLQSDLTFLMLRLIDRIEQKADTTNPVGDRILGTSVNGEPIKLKSIGKLNQQQLLAVASSVGRNTTFIWGPPGTGKTRTIGRIGEQLYLRDRSVLVVSHTNIAVDGAVRQIAEYISIESLARGEVLRVGTPKDLKLKEDIPDVLCQTHVERRSAKLAERRDTLQMQLSQIITEVKGICTTIEICEWLDKAGDDIVSMTNDLEVIEEWEVKLDLLKSELSEREDWSDYWNIAETDAQDTINDLAEIEKINTQVSKLKHQLNRIEITLGEIAKKLSKGKVILGEVSMVGWLMRKWRGLPSPEEQEEIVKNLQVQLGKFGLERDETDIKLQTILEKRIPLEKKVEAFRRKYSSEPSKVLRQLESYEENKKEIRQSIVELTEQHRSTYDDLKSLLESRLSAIQQFGLVDITHTSLKGMLDDIQYAFERAVEETKDLNLQELRIQRDKLNSRIRDIESETARIEEALKRIEQLVIADARVVATTLTCAYLRDSIQARKFDTVILDEASMAPIPSLWIAAGLAKASAVVVGDYRQLPPIVISEHDLAKKWLGQDIFNVANIVNCSVPHKVNLTEQHRMHPRISNIANELIYERILKDAEGIEAKDSELTGWCRTDWEYNSPVLLVDTDSLNAWVTSVPRGKRGSSRLNFLSAALCVNLAGQLLLDDRPTPKMGEKSRIVIACPYQPHAKLLQLLLREDKLEEDVRAGTVHSLQGSEASIVILDLVNDEPQWRVGMFIHKYDDVTTRLLNVALTRARRRLIIIGDFSYITKHAKKAFLGSELIPFLRTNYHCIDALDVVKSGLITRAAKAQVLTTGGGVVPDKARLVVTHEYFYKSLINDLGKARKRIVIYSPFITQNRLSLLELALRAAIERGVRVYVITKSRSERKKREKSSYIMLEASLTEWNVIVIHKQNMHEKLIFIDEDILWEGSLNPLSANERTGEHMERRLSKTVFQHYAELVYLKELLSEYKGGIYKCPCCGNEMQAREGRHIPFRWICTNPTCNYSRRIDQPSFPKDGIIKCCGTEVEYGEWGGKPAWRCIKNRRHRIPIVRAHLLLPKMRKIIPPKALVKLDKQFGIKPPGNDSTNNNVQGKLF